MTAPSRPPPTAAQQEVARIYLRNVGLVAVVALGALTLFVRYPDLYLGGAGVVVVTLTALYLWTRSEDIITMATDDKAVLVTGCDTGFGNLLAKQLAGMGVTVFAGCLHVSGEGATELQKLDNPRMHVVQMDVTKDDQIQDVVGLVQKTVGKSGLWGIVNNAALNFIGEIELTTMEQFERVTNINQLGVVRVTKAFLPLIRQSKGRIVNMTSVQGRLACIYNAAYEMTKFAGEVFSDVLRMEMAKFGVKVVIIEPCNFGGATGCLDMRRLQADYEAIWADLSPALRQTYGREYVFDALRRAEAIIPTTCRQLTLVTDKIVAGLFCDQPKTRYLIGGSSSWYDAFKVRALMYQWLPSWYMDGIFLRDIENDPKPTCLS